MNTIASAWQRISAWYDANTPIGTLTLAEGATEEEISLFEKEVGVALPGDLRSSFALHNGSADGGYLLHFGELLSLSGILRIHRMYQQWQTEENWGLGADYNADSVTGPIKPLWWNPLRLPLTDNSGDAVMADFDPPEDGQQGQIIEFDHEVGPRQVLAPSFGKWLTSVAEGLENGDYIYYEEEDTVAPPGINWSGD